MYCFCLSCILFVLVSLLLIFLRKNVSICSVYSCDFVCMDLHFKKKNSPLTNRELPHSKKEKCGMGSVSTGRVTG